MFNSGYTPVSLNENNLPTSESLVEAPPEHATASSVPMLEVTAPANLPEGYQLEVAYGSGQKMNVTIPAGGVEQGQTFSVPFPAVTESSAPSVPTSTASTVGGSAANDRLHIPVGHWRDDLLSCFRYGPCHPHCWTSWLFTFLATGQVVRRMRLDWTGIATDNPSRRGMAFVVILWIVVSYFILHTFLLAVLMGLDPNFSDADYGEPTHVQKPVPQSFVFVYFIYSTVGCFYWVLSTIVLIRTRIAVRKRFGIAGDASDCLEDVCCSVACHCCVAAQLLRHTTDYERYPAELCSDTGVPSYTPDIV